MAFDPDAFLLEPDDEQFLPTQNIGKSSIGGFDPDAFLAEDEPAFAQSSQPAYKYDPARFRPRGLTAPKAEEKPEDQGILRQVADIPLGIARGGVTGIKMMTDILGADNAVSKSLSGVEGYMADLMSAQAKEDQQEISRIMKDAEDKGFGEQVKAGIKAFSIAPVDIMSQALGTMAPVIATGLAGSAAKLGALGMRAVQAGVGAGMGAGMIKGEIYNEVKNELVNSGIAEDAAEKAAVEAQSYGGKNLDQILLGAGLGAASTLGAEGIITRILTKQGTAPAAGVVSRVLKGGLTEAAPEAAQAAQEQLAKNVALQREGFDVDPSRGVVAAATMEAVAAAPLGGIAGAVERPAPIKTLAEENLEQTNEIARKVAENGAPLTASAIQDQASTNLRQDELAKQLEAQLEEELVAVKEPTAAPPAIKSKEEFTAIYSQVAPEELDAAEAGFTNVLATAATEEARANAQNALEAIKEVKATITPPAPPVEPTITPTIQPAEPTAQLIPTDATQEIIQPEGVRPELETGTQVETEEAGVSDSLQPPARGEEEGQVIFGLRSVADNTATREQISALSEAGLVDIVKGKPVINEDGAAILAQPVAPAIVQQEPVTTPALEEAVTPAPIAEAPVAAPVEQVVTPPVEAAPTIAEAAPVAPITSAPVTEQAEPAEAPAPEGAQISEVMVEKGEKLPPKISDDEVSAEKIKDAKGRSVLLDQKKLSKSKDEDIISRYTVLADSMIRLGINDPVVRVNVARLYKEGRKRNIIPINKGIENYISSSTKKLPTPESVTPAPAPTLGQEVVSTRKGNVSVERIKTSTEDTKAYHYGDTGIGRDTTMDRMDAGRSTGHFGTGTYFLGKKESGFAVEGRPLVNIDLSELNLAKPSGVSSMMLHDGLKRFNKSIFNNEKIKFNQPSDDGSRMLSEIYISLIGQTKETDVQDAIKKVESIFTSGENDGLRTPSTYLMQELGFDGIDVRGTELDNTDYGSVVFANPVPAVSETITEPTQAAVTAQPTEFGFVKDIDSARENIKKNLIRFASGMSGLSDMRRGSYARAGHRNYGIGAVAGLLSKNAINELADRVINMDVHTFIDSGAFGHFIKEQKLKLEGKTLPPLNFDKILAKYDLIIDEINNENAIEKDDYPRPLIVTPDKLGDQNESLNLTEKYKNWIAARIEFNDAIPIIPIPLGKLTLSQAYNRIVEILKTNTIGAEINPNKFIVGIPSNATAVSREDLANFLQETKHPRIHFLGAAADSKISPLIDVVAKVLPDTLVTADASQIRSKIAGAKKEGKTREEATFGALYQEDDPNVILESVKENPSILTPTAPIEAVAPSGPAVGNRVQLGNSPQTYIVEEVIPQSESEKANNEQSYSIRNEKTGEILISGQKGMKVVGGKKRRMAAKPTPLPDNERYGQVKLNRRVQSYFGGKIPNRVYVVDDAVDPEYEYKAAYYPDEGILILNNAFIRKNENIGDIIAHELGHYAFGDAKFKAAFDEFYNSLTPEEKADIDQLMGDSYNNETEESQMEERKVIAFTSFTIATPQRRSLWNAVLDAMKAFLNRVFGKNFKMSDPTRTALAMLATAKRRFAAGEEIVREDIQARKMAAQTQDARFAELESRAKAGDKEAEAEAQRMVDEAAKAAGYNQEAFHGVAQGVLEGSAFDLNKLGSNTGAASARMGIFASGKKETAQSYVEKAQKSSSAEIIANRIEELSKKVFEKTKPIRGRSLYENTKNMAENIISTIRNNKTFETFISDPFSRGSVNELLGRLSFGLVKDQLGESDPLFSEIEDLRGNIIENSELIGSRKVLNLKINIGNAFIKDYNGNEYRDESYASLIEKAKNQGYDSVIFKNTYDGGPLDNIYVVFNPNQIKSADPFTYDDAGNLIPLSERFQTTSPDIRRMAAEAEPRRVQVGGAVREESKYITTPKGILAKNTDVIREKFFDSRNVSPENTTKAWGYISRLLDIKSGNARAFAGEINDTVDTELEAQRQALIDAGDTKAAGEKYEKEIAAAMFSVELMNYAGKLAAQGDRRMIKFLNRNINDMPTGGVGSVSQAGDIMRTRREYDVDGYGALKAEQQGKTDRTAAALFGKTNPSKDQVNAVEEAIKESDRVELGDAGEVASEIEKVEKRTGRKIIKKIDEKIKESKNPKKDELLISFQNLNQQEKLTGVKTIYKPQKIDPAKNIKDLIIGKLVNYRKTLIKQGADGLESTFWQTMSDQERKPGPLGEIDQAQNNELAKIVQKTLIDLGLKGEPPNTKMTDIEKVASILNKQLLGEEKKILADSKIVAEIERRRQSEIETSGDEDAVNQKYDAILDAWNQAMSRQTNMPISDNMLQRLINAELKEQKFGISDLVEEADGKIVSERKNDIVKSILSRIYKVSKEAETGVEMDEDYNNLERYLSQTLNNMYDLHVQKKNAAFAKRKARIESLQSPEVKAQAVLDSLSRELDEAPPFPQGSENVIRGIVQQDLRQNPDMGREQPWKSQLTGKLLQAGATEYQAETIANLVWRQHQIKAMDRELNEMKVAAEEGSLKVIIQRIKDTPLEKQQEAGWRESVIKDYLISAGLDSKAAETAAKLYDSVISERLAEAKQKAFEETLKGSAPWKDYLARNSRLAKDALDKIRVAIRTGVLDPEQTTEDIIARENGWTGFTKEQYQRIVQLDSIINNPENDDVSRREAMAQLNQIIADAKLPVRFKDALGAYYVGNALMGIPTVTVNIASPIGFTVRNMMTDIGRYAFTDPARIPLAFESFLDSMRSWYDQTSYAFKNQIYLNDVVEYLQGQNVLRELFDKGKKQWANGEYAAGFVNMAVGMTQITGRVLSSLDQGAIAMLENQNITRYAMEALAANTKGKVPKDKLKEFANMVLDTKRRVIAENVANGMPRDRAGVLADLAVKSEIIAALSTTKAGPMVVLDAAINDALLSVGRNKAITINGITKATKNLKDEGLLSYLPISFLETIASDAGRQGSAMQIFSKMLYGFALVPARVFHNVAWFSPYGFIRLYVDKIKKNKGQDSPYAMSLQTDAQYKQRLTEAIAGSIVMLGLAALRAGSSDDEDDKQFKIVITGNGPSATTDRQYFDSWNKKWKPYSIHIVVGDTIIPINIGRGGEALFFPIMLAGAMDDWEIKKKQNDTKKEPEDLSMMASMLGSSFFALAQRGPYAAFTKPLFDASKEGRVTEELASQAGYFGKTFIPLLGTSVARNITDFINDPVDRSSVEGAIYANTPIVGPWMGAKALNALGQPVRADDWGDKLFKLGVPVVFSFPKNTPMNELNELILKQGSGPTIPTRTNAQKRFGDILTDKEFETYVREYGQVMSDRMFKNRTKLARMKPSDYDDELEKYARGYSAGDFKIKGASDAAVQAVKRMRQ